MTPQNGSDLVANTSRRRRRVVLLEYLLFNETFRLLAFLSALKGGCPTWGLGNGMAVMTDRPSRPKNLDFFTGMAVGPEIKMQILEILGPEILEQIHILCPFLALNYNLLKTLPLNILLGTRNYSHLRASVRSGGWLLLEWVDVCSRCNEKKWQTKIL